MKEITRINDSVTIVKHPKNYYYHLIDDKEYEYIPEGRVIEILLNLGYTNEQIDSLLNYDENCEDINLKNIKEDIKEGFYNRIVNEGKTIYLSLTYDNLEKAFNIHTYPVSMPGIGITICYLFEDEMCYFCILNDEYKEVYDDISLCIDQVIYLLKDLIDQANDLFETKDVNKDLKITEMIENNIIENNFETMD